MKPITIAEETFQYETFCVYNEHTRVHYTNFYQGTEDVSYRQFLFFGKKITKTRPKFSFQVDINIENPNFTKEQVKEKIDAQLKLIARRKQILNGEII